MTSFLGVPFVKASSSQEQRSSKLILKKSLRYESPIGMVNPPLFRVHWNENFSQVFFGRSPTSRSSHVFSTKHIQKTGDWTNFEEVQENDDISCPSQRKIRGTWPSPVDDPHLFDVARPFHLAERHRLLGIRDAKDFGS